MANPGIVDMIQEKGLITYHCLRRKFSGLENSIFPWPPAKLSSAILHTPQHSHPPPPSQHTETRRSQRMPQYPTLKQTRAFFEGVFSNPFALRTTYLVAVLHLCHNSVFLQQAYVILTPWASITTDRQLLAMLSWT